MIEFGNSNLTVWKSKKTTPSVKVDLELDDDLKICKVVTQDELEDVCKEMFE
jgi:hypothetical protein